MAAAVAQNTHGTSIQIKDEYIEEMFLSVQQKTNLQPNQQKN